MHNSTYCCLVVGLLVNMLRFVPLYICLLIANTTDLNYSFQLYSLPRQICIWSSEVLVGEINSLRQTSELVLAGCSVGGFHMVTGDQSLRFWATSTAMLSAQSSPVVQARMLNTYHQFNCWCWDASVFLCSTRQDPPPNTFTKIMQFKDVPAKPLLH